MELPFERDAMNNKSVPDSLCMTDKKLYIALRGIYQQYKAKQITKDQAAADKAALLKDYELERAKDTLSEQAAGAWLRIGNSAHNYAVEPTIKNADTFYADVFGLPEYWRNFLSKDGAK